MKKLVILSVFVFVGTINVIAQPAPADPDPKFTPTPFGFVEVLIAAGAALGGKKAYDKYKNKAE